VIEVEEGESGEGYSCLHVMMSHQWSVFSSLSLSLSLCYLTFTKWLPSAVRSRSVRASGSSADEDDDGSSEEVSSLRDEREIAQVRQDRAQLNACKRHLLCVRYGR
jgi:hypothetical protein